MAVVKHRLAICFDQARLNSPARAEQFRFVDEEEGDQVFLFKFRAAVEKDRCLPYKDRACRTGQESLSMAHQIQNIRLPQ